MLDPNKQRVKIQDLIDDIAEGYISINMLQLALRGGVRRWDNIPEEIRDLLCGRDETYSGFIRQCFFPLKEGIGAIELAFRRGKQGKLSFDFKEVLKNA